MLWCFLRRLVLVVVGLAFMGATTVQAMPQQNVEQTTSLDASMPCCDGPVSMHPAGTTAPCKGMTPECLKVMQCLGVPDRPTQAAAIGRPVRYSVITYSVAQRIAVGRSPEPLSFPPRTA
ncbi:hypothetical protein [Acetobacter aceti]|uniref:Uncharacterized protein n=1 Tax=Acetobacter aceti TaxID=435 RepID=A0A6S6PQY1_ACEAC|nr:hypothetical protein [Acetobacter aceti]BCI69101.1 hypothetical protein AAJCM20276_37250 [Acetobacter aceti]